APVTSGGPSSNPVVGAEPPAHCATFSYTLQSSYGPGPKPFTDARIMRGLSFWMCSQVNPMRSSAPGAKFSTITSQVFTSSSSTALPCGLRPSMVIERLLWFSMVKYRLSTLGMSCSWPRVMSPTPGRSTLMQSAPSQARSCVQVGPDCTWVKSRTRTPSSALPAWPQALGERFARPLEAASRFALVTVFATGLFVFSLTILFAAGPDLGLTFALAFTFLLFAIVVSFRTGSARLYPRHARACPAHPRLAYGSQGVDGRDKPGHDDVCCRFI